MPTPNEWDEVAVTYEATIEKITGQYADDVIAHLRPSPGRHIADIACGPGVVTLAAAALGATVTSLDFSSAMVARLRDRIAEAGVAALVDAHEGDAAALPFTDALVDAAGSNFGVIFCPDAAAAIGELARITRSGGELMITAWTTVDKNGWTSLLAPDYADELGFVLAPRVMFHWQTAADIRATCEANGWTDVTVETRAGSGPPFPSWDKVGGALDAPASKEYLVDLSEAQRAALRAYVVRRAHEVYGDGQVDLPREAWLVRGRSA